MGLSRVGGFSFIGKHITNMDFNLNTYKLISVDRPASPKMTYREFIVPNRNGSTRYDNRYEDKPIKVVIGVRGTAIERQEKITLLLQDWIGQEGRLIFDDRPNLFYNARFYDAITSKDTDIFTEITISFIASYVMYELNYDETDFTDELPTRVAIINTGTKTTINYGNFEANPIIEISGTATLAIIAVNDTQFSVTNISDTVYIDTEKMIVYRIVDGNKVSKLTDFQGLFPKIKKGENTVTVSGTNVNATTKIKYRNTYIC